MQQADILIKDASIVDGTGSPWFYGDLAIKGDSILDIGANLSAKYQANKVIDAGKKLVCPGFVDIHTHSDFALIREPNSYSKLIQGVTTQAIGQCGYSAAPVTDDGLESLHQYGGFLMAGVNPDWSWRSFAEWLDYLDNLELGTNVASFVGHGTIRIASMGFENRQATATEIAEMQKSIKQCMQEGAIGMTSGLIYPPGIFSDISEMEQIASSMSSFGGLYESHIRSESDDVVAAVAEILEVGKKAGVAVQISHHKACGAQNRGKVHETLALVDKARNAGQDVTVNVYPYEACSTTLRAILPSWVQEGNMESLYEKLASQEIRDKLYEEIKTPSSSWDNYYLAASGAEGIILLFFPHTPEYEGKTLAEVAKEKGQNPLDTAFDLIIANKGTDTCAYNSMFEEDVDFVMQHPASFIASDSIPSPVGAKSHPRAASTFIRVLDKYVKERKVLTLEQAIHKMSAFPARKMGFHDRGILAPGMKADVILIDLEKVKDNADFVNTDAEPEGVETVIVNGCLTIEDGKTTAGFAGKVLRKQ